MNEFNSNPIVKKIKQNFDKDSETIENKIKESEKELKALKIEEEKNKEKNSENIKNCKKVDELITYSEQAHKDLITLLERNNLLKSRIETLKCLYNIIFSISKKENSTICDDLSEFNCHYMFYICEIEDSKLEQENFKKEKENFKYIEDFLASLDIKDLEKRTEFFCNLYRTIGILSSKK